MHKGSSTLHLTKCTCCNIFADPLTRRPVARSLLNLFRMDLNTEKNIVLGWWQYATNNRKSKTHSYIITFDASPKELFVRDERTVDKLLHHRVCALTFMQILQQK